MRFKNCEGQIVSWIETLSAYTFTVQHRAGRIHNNVDALSRRPCKDDHRYENRYSSETLAEINTSGAVKAIAFNKEKSESDKHITHYVIGGDHEIYPVMGVTRKSHCPTSVALRSTKKVLPL